MERTEFQYPSKDGRTQLHGVVWKPEGEIRAIVQISHGMMEYVLRYDEFARFLAQHGILVTGNDHLGHGQSVVSENDWGYFCEGDGSSTVVDDLYALTVGTKEQYPGVPYFLLGHSMGSFLLRRYLMTYGDGLTGALVVGTGDQSGFLLRIGRAVVGLFSLLFGPRHRSKLVDRLVFGNNNGRITDVQSKNDWVTKDREIVEKYNNDPACTFQFTMNGYRTLFTTIQFIKKQKNIEKIPKNLPLILLAGAQDPVGEYGAAIKRVYARYKAAGIWDISMKLYENDRHEILNETDRDEVYADILAWIEQRIPRGRASQGQ